MGKRLPEELERILQNKTSGSTELLEGLNRFFLHHPDKIDQFGEFIAAASMRLSPFASVQNYLNELKGALNTGAEETRLFLLASETRMRSFYRRIYENAAPMLKDFRSIITISNSYTLAQVFKLWHEDNPDLKVIVTESRAMMEGRIMAERLLGYGFRVEFILDSMMAEFMAGCDAAVTGADQVLSNGNVVNKSGSSLLALASRHFNKPFIVLAGKDKFTSSDIYTQKEYPKEEVWNFSHRNLRVWNHYFEEVDRKLITHIVTD